MNRRTIIRLALLGAVILLAGFASWRYGRQRAETEPPKFASLAHCEAWLKTVALTIPEWDQLNKPVQQETFLWGRSCNPDGTPFLFVRWYRPGQQGMPDLGVFEKPGRWGRVDVHAPRCPSLLSRLEERYRTGK